jgi:tRNA A37 methylthiotransferase MiaB
MREKTTAHRRFKDNVPQEVKNRRLNDMVKVYRRTAQELMANYDGQRQLVLIEGSSKRSTSDLYGRNDGNIKVIVPRLRLPIGPESSTLKDVQPGDFIVVDITKSNSQVLKGNPLYHSSIGQFHKINPVEDLALA